MCEKVCYIITNCKNQIRCSNLANFLIPIPSSLETRLQTLDFEEHLVSDTYWGFRLWRAPAAYWRNNHWNGKLWTGTSVDQLDKRMSVIKKYVNWNLNDRGASIKKVMWVPDGLMDGWCESHFKDCLQHSTTCPKVLVLHVQSSPFIYVSSSKCFFIIKLSD